MRRRFPGIIFMLCLGLLALAPRTEAAHPLITDDTGTLGKGNVQIELVGEYGRDTENGVTTNAIVFPTIPVLSYGIADTVDLVISYPFMWIETKMDGEATKEKGFSDIFLEVKWRLHEKDTVSFAVKPGITLPAGDENKGLGTGRASYHAFFIATKEMSAWAFHLNIGHFRNEYKLKADNDANRKDRWHLSFASEADIAKGLQAVVNVGMERNPDKTSDTHPVFLLGGLRYSVTDNLDADVGVKGGLNKPEADRAYLLGITVRF